MAKKPTVLADSDIITRVLAKASASVGWYDSKLSKERTRVTDYYNGVLPRRTSDGSSSYISTDVYDAVETTKAVTLETFAGGDDIAQFDPDGTMNADQCRAATQYASYVIFRQNEGFNLFQSVIHDGLTARVGVAKIYWEQKHSLSEETFEGLSHEDASAIAAHDEVYEFEGTHSPETNTYSGTLTRKEDTSKITCEPIAPEEFLIEPRATSIAKAKYCGHRTLKTKAELLDMGYKKSLVMALKYSDPTNVDYSAEALARNSPVESGSADDNPIQDELQQVLLYESYVWLQIDSSKGVRLYKICHVDDKLLSKEEVDKAPFLAYVPLPVPHMLFGNNFAARVIPTQNARTVLMRGVLDHTAISTNPRWQVVNGGLMNPRELLENRMGGLVNVRRPDTVTPLAQNVLNPYVFNVMKLLSEDKEQSTGNSSLSTGMNKDAVSTQNSQGLIDNMMKASGQRAKIAARNFAYNFFVPLMIEVIRLTLLHVSKDQVIDVAGTEITVSPQDWTERKSCSVSMHLGYGEKDKLAQTIAHTYEMFTKDPSIRPMFKLENRYAMLMDGLKAARLPGAMNYLTTPDKVEAEPPDPFKTRELDIKDKLANAALAQAEAANDKNEKTLALSNEELNVKKHSLAINALDNDRTNDRHDLETANRIDTAQREVKLLEAQPLTESKGFASPA